MGLENNLLPRMLVAEPRQYVANGNRLAQERWDIGRSDRWSADLAEGTLSFHFGDRVIIGPAHVLGTYSSETSTWLWGCANGSLTESVVIVSANAVGLGRSKNISVFAQRKLTVNENAGDDFAAVAAMLTGMVGVYRVPTRTGYVWFGMQTFGDEAAQEAGDRPAR